MSPTNSWGKGGKLGQPAPFDFDSRQIDPISHGTIKITMGFYQLIRHRIKLMTIVEIMKEDAGGYCEIAE